jgi:hypothetical protein
MDDLTIVTTSDRRDLDDEARAALRENWPELIFHDPVVAQYLGRVETYFPSFDLLLLVVPEALDLVEIDREHDIGTYAEANLWMRHL